jgi:hypothetical protein
VAEVVVTLAAVAAAVAAVAAVEVVKTVVIHLPLSPSMVTATII